MDYYGPMNRYSYPFASALAASCLACTLFAGPCAAAEAPPAPNGLSSTLFYEILVGELSAQTGQSGDAYQLMLDAARKANAPELYQRSMEIALRARAGDSALDAVQAWLRAFPGSPQAQRFQLEILIGLNRLPDTVEPVRHVLSGLKPAQRAGVIEELPRFFARAADKKAALKVLEAALAPELGNPQTGPAAYAAIGTMRVLGGDAAGALESARKGLALNPAAREPALLALGLMDSRLPAAEELLQQYLQTDAPPEVRMGYVRKLLEDQRYDDASKQVMLLTTVTPDFADAWLVRGSLEMQSKDNASAESSLQKYLALKQQDATQAAALAPPPAPLAGAKADDSDDGAPQAGTDRGAVQAYFLLAQIAVQSKNYELAQQMLDQINSPSDVLRLNTQRALILARQGKIDAARALIQGTPENAPEDARAKIDAEAELLRDSKLYQAEYELLSAAAQASPDDIDLRYDLAMAADKVNKPDEMEALLRQVIASKPDYPHAYNALGYALADRNARLPEARTLIEKALQLAPDDPYIIDSLGWVEFRSGELQEALKNLRHAFDSKHDAEIAAHLGEVLWSLNQQSAARAIWTEGLKINPDNETLLETIKRLNTL